MRLGLLDHVDGDAVFISGQIGIAKPNPKLYQTALADLKLDPHRVMYVGDSKLHDIAPPNGLGMVTVWSRRSAKNPTAHPEIEATHTVDDFTELAELLTTRYDVPALPALA